MGYVDMLSYIIWDINPDIFVIPGINHPVRWYGLSWAFGFLFGQQVMFYIYKKEGRSRDEIETLTVYIIISAMVGARLGHVFFYDPIEFLSDPIRILMIWEGGLASHGAGIAVPIALYFFSRKTHVNYLWIVDRLVIVSALAGCLIRLGNLMNSEMVGLPTTLPWGFVFTSIDEIPRHPAQLYEAIYCFFLFVLLFWLWSAKRDQIKEGFLTGWFLVILFSLRFVDEFFKINQVSFEDEMVLNMGQILSIPFVLIGVAILIWTKDKPQIQETTSPSSQEIKST
jgi:phosphatidylglycerol---prolipoprotein diacylglyceryl transferase